MITVTYYTLRPQVTTVHCEHCRAADDRPGYLLLKNGAQGLLVCADQVVSITEQSSKRSLAAVKANQTRKARKAKTAA